MNQRQLQVIDYLREENRVLREQVGARRLVAADFFTVEVWTPRGLERLIVLFFMELCARRVQIAGITASPNRLWMSQIGRNLSDAIDGLFRGKRYLIHDRDPLFTCEFLKMLAEVGVKSVKLPPRSPDLKAQPEIFVLSIKESCLERLMLFGEDALRKAIRNSLSITLASATTKVLRID
jgi:putative transposase